MPKEKSLLESCGYGFTFRASEAGKRGSLSGVLGVAGGNLELHALVGLPNVIRFVWSHEFRELPAAPRSSRQAKVLHELQRPPKN